MKKMFLLARKSGWRRQSRPKLAMVFLLLIACMTVSSVARAQSAWYAGEVKRIYLVSNGFIITMKSSALDDCLHKYLYFQDGVIGERNVNRAYSMVLSAKARGALIGVVIDKAINGPNGKCESNGNMDTRS